MNTIVIIGAGASGMMAAITAKRMGANVSLLEQNQEIGKKILSTGNGRCNFTNLVQEPMMYHSDNLGFAWKVIERFTAQDTLRFFSEIGVYSKNRGGYMYPNSEQATAILNVLRWQIEELEIPVITDSKVQVITHDTNVFRIQTTTGIYQANRVILACGSRASRIAGADGSGYALATKLGHSLIPVLPALVQLKCEEDFYKQLAGVRVQGLVSLYVGKECVAKDEGEIQLTKYGISGIPVFQISRHVAIALQEKKYPLVSIDFMQHFKEEQLYNFLEDRKTKLSYRFVNTFFIGVFPEKLGEVILQRCNIDRQKQVAMLSNEELQALVDMIKQFQTTVVATNDYEQAQVCRGGVNTKEVCANTLESCIVPNLYFAGEILDVDGMCGGYNLQWAWSSGYVAGSEATK